MLATKTLALIDQTLRKDQGALFRQIFKDKVMQADDVFRGKESPFRSHLGASILGRECAREIWYSFRWTTRPEFDGKTLRLFNRGHLEEPRMLALLEMIGCTVWSINSKGKQFRVKGHFGHSGGSLDAVIKGIPECPDTPLLGEFKTHGEKSFIKLKEEGLLKAKWEHFVQMTVYMGKIDLPGGLYMATNKNTDEIYAELVAFDKVQFDRYDDRARMIVEATEPPPRINESKSFFKCKFCDHREVCHSTAKPEKTCRSCAHSVLSEGGSWLCGFRLSHKEGRVIFPTLSPEDQERGCSDYSPIDFKGKP